MLRLSAICAAITLVQMSAAPAVAEPAAKVLFGAKTRAANLAPRSFGSYVRGCLAGGAMLPVNGPAWQAMRLSRNRNWGHPELVAYVERLALDAKAHDNWPGLLVGDLAQPRGGPMVSGHRSHQIGLDADIWLNPMPPHRLTHEEREKISAVSILASDKLSINPEVWTPGHVKLLKRAASYPQVARIFVHPAIKKAVCEAAGVERRWLRKIRPWWGHHYHFHVRLKCPRGKPGCANQAPPPPGDGCGKQLDYWFEKLKNAMKPRKKPKKPLKKRPPLTMAQLPSACRTVLAAKDEPPGREAIVGGSVDPGLPWLQGLATSGPSRAFAQPLSAQPLSAEPATGVPLPERKPR